MDSDEVGEISKENIFRVKWQVDNFFSLSDEVDSSYASSAFYFLNGAWYLKMYPNGQTKNASEGWIGLFLIRNGSTPQSVRYTLAIRKADGTDEKFISNRRSTRFSEEQPGWGSSNFLERSELLIQKSQLAPSDALTIVCTMWSDGMPSEEDERLVSCEAEREDLFTGWAREDSRSQLDIKGGDILRKNLCDLFLYGEDQDVILKVQNQRFRAHKCILRARSSMFADKFDYDMTENECGDLCIEDCNPNAFGEFLKYVYVGKMENISPSTATELYSIADKYDFPDLKETCVEFLKESLTTEVIADVITFAMEHNEEELLECAMEFFSNQIMEILMTVEWQRFIESNPVLSNELTIKAMKISRTRRKH